MSVFSLWRNIRSSRHLLLSRTSPVRVDARIPGLSRRTGMRIASSFSSRTECGSHSHSRDSLWVNSVRKFSALQQSEDSSAVEADSESIPFLLADIGEGIREVELLEWYVTPGQSVQQFDKVCLVQSDKATVEITSRYDGAILELAGEVGDTVLVGQPLLHMQADPETSTTAPAQVSNQPASHDNPMDSSASSFDEPNEQISSDNMDNQEEAADRVRGAVASKIETSPAVRKLAREHDIDLSKVKMTGPRGRILKEDVLNYIGQADSLSDSHLSSPARLPSSLYDESGGKIMTLRGMSRFMVKSMTESLSVPQMGLGDDIILDQLLDCKRQLKEATDGTNVSLLAFFLKGCSMALDDYPLMNSTIRGDIAKDFQVELVPHHNIGIAMDTANGLVVPVIQKVETLSVSEIQQEINRLKKAASGTGVGIEDLSPPSFTLSNIGSLGVGTSLQPVLGPPLVAMGATGRIQTLPRFNEQGEVVPMSVMHVSWAGDHRVLDGATLARFHISFAKYVTNPVHMLSRLK